MIPSSIKIKNHDLPDSPGVYLMKDAEGKILYVGKAISLKRRVNQYWQRPHGTHIEEMMHQVRAVDYLDQPTAIEALILEANLIKQFQPPYNILQKDNTSFLYLVITKDPFPQPLLIRGAELEEGSSKKYKAIFGPYTSAPSLRAALELLRKIFPWSTCEPGQKRPCFYVHLKLCPGVCIGAIDQKSYGKIIRDLIKFFEGKKSGLIRQYRREMQTAAKAKKFERAADLRNKIFSLEHIQDVAVIKKEDDALGIREARGASVKKTGLLFHRVEGYDISHISGTASVGSMVVFENGAPAKAEYRKFKIKTVSGPNDVASLQEVLARRFHNPWRRPSVLLIDGGRPQVHAVEQVMDELGIHIPIIGIAKGPERKRNDLILSKNVPEALIQELALEESQLLLEKVRDEAHRFAITYHKKLRGRGFIQKRG